MGKSSKGGRGYTKTSLNSRTALRLPDPEKAFHLYVHENEGIALGMLTQRLGPEPQPVACLSKSLDPTFQGWPPCLRNLAAIAVLIEDSLNSPEKAMASDSSTLAWKIPWKEEPGRLQSVGLQSRT